MFIINQIAKGEGIDSNQLIYNLNQLREKIGLDTDDKRLLDMLFYWDFGNHQSEHIQSNLKEYKYNRIKEENKPNQMLSSHVSDNSKESICSVSDTEGESMPSVADKNKDSERLNAHRNTGMNICYSRHHNWTSQGE